MIITQMAPKEIDEILSSLWYAEAILRGRIDNNKKALARIEANAQDPARQHRNSATNTEWVKNDLAEKEAKLVENRAEAAPYEAEYKSRSWNRYFLVKQANGHVHRGTHCTTCFLGTQYGWLTNLSDCDEGQMIEEYGEHACTVCFPNAPVNPFFIKSQEEREAADKAKEDATCRGGNYAYNSARMQEQCKECGAFAAPTPNCALRAHKRKVE